MPVRQAVPCDSEYRSREVQSRRQKKGRTFRHYSTAKSGEDEQNLEKPSYNERITSHPSPYPNSGRGSRRNRSPTPPTDYRSTKRRRYDLEPPDRYDLREVRSIEYKGPDQDFRDSQILRTPDLTATIAAAAAAAPRTLPPSRYKDPPTQPRSFFNTNTMHKPPKGPRALMRHQSGGNAVTRQGGRFPSAGVGRSTVYNELTRPERLFDKTPPTQPRSFGNFPRAPPKGPRALMTSQSGDACSELCDRSSFSSESTPFFSFSGS
ncbi:hypothetical protein L218DRAFT_191182 [Marasmius fiardii PR-910]|nr:hypothetical protein L218DRAFT_191182 [Marasmius fiardii PR-910]